MAIDPTVPLRLRARLVETDDGCWLWTGTLARGYGQTRWGEGGRAAPRRYVHDVIYELLIGPIPVGLEPDHTCRRKACANPAHLEPVTHAENCRRAYADRPYPCGHARIPGVRRCPPCRRVYQAQWAANRRAPEGVSHGN